MRYGKWFIGLITAMLFSIVVFFGTREYAWDGTVGVEIEMSIQGETETIRCWKSEWGDYFLFLPEYADLSQTRIRTNTRRTVKLDDLVLKDGMSCNAVQLEHQYDLIYNGDRQFHLTFLNAGELPSLFLETASGSMTHIHERKGNEEAGYIRLYSEGGILVHEGHLESVRGRGNATWIRSKKPYSLTLHTEADLLDMGAAEEWILMANAYDPTNMRNALAVELAKTLEMEYTPELRWVTLYLNGEYAGVYMLSERNEVHAQRVNIAPNGSFLVSMELQYRLEEQGYPYVLTDSGISFRIHHGETMPEMIQQHLQAVENAILSADGIDSQTGKSWQELIDLDSWAKKYLLEEILGNYDAGSVSQYFNSAEKIQRENSTQGQFGIMTILWEIMSGKR